MQDGGQRDVHGALLRQLRRWAPGASDGNGCRQEGAKSTLLPKPETQKRDPALPASILRQGWLRWNLINPLRD